MLGVGWFVSSAEKVTIPKRAFSSHCRSTLNMKNVCFGFLSKKDLVVMMTRQDEDLAQTFFCLRDATLSRNQSLTLADPI